MNFDRNTILAFVLAIAVIVGWQYFFPSPKQHPAATQTEAVSKPAQTQMPAQDTGAVPGTPPAPETPTAPEQRIKIATAHLHGSITLTGARFDDISLATYHETLDPNSPEHVLLSPTTTDAAYYAEMGWLSSDKDVALPGPATVWSTANPDAQLTETTPLVLTWDNGQGLHFTRTISVDSDYLFTIEQTIENTSGNPVTLFPYSLIARFDPPTNKSTMYSFEGPLGVFDGTYKEEKYAAVKKAGDTALDSTGGWIGIADKYWLSAIAYDQQMKVKASFNYGSRGGHDRYQTDLRGDAVTVPAGEKRDLRAYMFAGAKELAVLDRYSKAPGLKRLDLAIDFGSWLWVLTDPFFRALQWLHSLLGNFGLAILALSTIVRLLMFPIANKQYSSMNKMKKLQPQMKALQERFASDKQRQHQEMMELYKREKVNPLAGCLPIVVQLPVFIALYKVLYVTIEMRQAPFYGWIHDLSAPDPTSILNLFGLFHYAIPHFLAPVSLGAWPLIYGIAMFLQQRMSPPPGDPAQARVMMYMPVIFTFILASMPVGLVIYWAWGSVLAILQQYILLRREA